MNELINTIVSAIERLLQTVNSAKKFLSLVSLSILLTSLFFSYQLLGSPDFLQYFIGGKIERVSGWCYQQKIRNDRRIVGIQFPIPNEVQSLQVIQNLAALVFTGPSPAYGDFTKMCDSLVADIIYGTRRFELQDPQRQKRLQEYYKSLDRVNVQQQILLGK